jgi:hypothetical protein
MPPLRPSFSLSRFLPVFLLAVFASAARATSIIPPTFDELVDEATTVVRGTVTAVRAEEFDSPQGRGVHTFVTLRVERTLKGAPADTLTLTLLGGTVGKRTLRIAGIPTFNVGQRQVVFVARNGEVMCPLIGAGHGRYHVVTDATTQREYLTRDNLLPLTSTDEIALPLASGATAALVGRSVSATSALTLDTFETRILDAVARARSVPQRP